MQYYHPQRAKRKDKRYGDGYADHETMSGTIIWALAGLGRIGSTLENDPLREKPCTHAGAIAAHPRAVLAAGCDIEPAARDAFAAQWEHLQPRPLLFDNMERMLQEVRPDIVTIATPPDAHLPLVRLCARRGVPVVVCEKPLAWKRSEARAIRNLERRGALRLLLNHERRFSADYLAVREAVLSERYGKLLSIGGMLCFGRTAPHRSVLIHDGTHMIDAVNFLSGERFRPLHRSGAAASGAGSFYLIGRAGSADVCIETGSGRDHLVFRLDLGFESGKIEIGNGLLRFFRSVDSPFYSGFRSLVPDTTPSFDTTGYFSGMISAAVRLHDHPEAPSPSSAEDGWAVLKAIGG